MDLVGSLPSQPQPLQTPLGVYESAIVTCHHPFYLSESVSDASVLDPEMYQRHLITFTLLQTIQEIRTLNEQLGTLSAIETGLDPRTIPFRSIMESWACNFSDLYMRTLLTVGADELPRFCYACICNPDRAVREVDFPLESVDDNGWMRRDVHHCTYTNGTMLLWVVHPASGKNVEMEVRDNDLQFVEKMIRLRWLARKWQYECKWAGTVSQWQALEMESLRLPL